MCGPNAIQACDIHAPRYAACVHCTAAGFGVFRTARQGGCQDQCVPQGLCRDEAYVDFPKGHAHDTLQYIDTATSVVGSTYSTVAALCFGVCDTTATNAGTCIGLNGTSSTFISCRIIALTPSRHTHCTYICTCALVYNKQRLCTTHGIRYIQAKSHSSVARRRCIHA